MYIQRKQIDKPMLFYALRQLFSACNIAYTPKLAGDKRLFYCYRSMKFISIHRLRPNGFGSCYYGEDGNDFLTRDIMLRSNMTSHFKCVTYDE